MFTEQSGCSDPSDRAPRETAGGLAVSPVSEGGGVLSALFSFPLCPAPQPASEEPVLRTRGGDGEASNWDEQEGVPHGEVLPTVGAGDLRE